MVRTLTGTSACNGKGILNGAVLAMLLVVLLRVLIVITGLFATVDVFRMTLWFVGLRCSCLLTTHGWRRASRPRPRRPLSPLGPRPQAMQRVYELRERFLEAEGELYT